MRQSKFAPDWWDYTCLDPELLNEAAALKGPQDLAALSRPGFRVRIWDTLWEFYAAEACEYVQCWRQSTPDNPCGICGPIGPTEQLPIVAQMVNDQQIDVRNGHFWGMDEWVENGVPVTPEHPLSFARADLQMCFNRIDPELRMPDSHLHFPGLDLGEYSATFKQARCLVMQGGQGQMKHWAFNDPLRRRGAFADNPPAPEDYWKLGARVVDLHPGTLMQNARTSGGGRVDIIPSQAATVGPAETRLCERISIWHPGHHDDPFGQRLTTLMLSKTIASALVPMSLLSLHPGEVTFNFYAGGVGTCEIEMH